MGIMDGDLTTMPMMLAVDRILQRLDEEIEGDTIMIGGVSDEAEVVEKSKMDVETI